MDEMMDVETSTATLGTIFQTIEERRERRELRSYTTLAFAEFHHPDGHDSVIASMNGTGGLVSRQFRGIPGVQYFSINSRSQNVISIPRNGVIERAQNRHAEMNIVMFVLAQHLSNTSNTISNFSLDPYLKSINPTQLFCPECQLAISLLSKPGAQLISSISEHIMDDNDTHKLALRRLSNNMLSERWAPPWTSYYQDVPGSDYFRYDERGNDPDKRGKLKHQGMFLITLEGRVVVIWQWEKGPGKDRWQQVTQIRVRHE